jgi:hypothetical protein
LRAQEGINEPPLFVNVKTYPALAPVVANELYALVALPYNILPTVGLAIVYPLVLTAPEFPATNS